MAVSFEPKDRLFQLSRELRLPFPILSDQERDSYQAYGLKRGSLGQIFSPRTILAYVKVLARGRVYHFHRSDLRQLGGDFIIGSDGEIIYTYCGATPDDRPSVDELIGRI